MLALLGIITIGVLLLVIMTKWMSPLIALILIPLPIDASGNQLMSMTRWKPLSF